MTTFTRKLKRARYRKAGKEWPAKEQPSIALTRGGYRTLRPTKGWLTVSPKRLHAQAIIRHMVETIERRKVMAR